MICDNLGINQRGNLTFAGYDTVELANKYSTPLYLFDEEKIRQNCRVYVDAMNKFFGNGSKALYASKAASFKQIYRIVNEEGMGVDVVSGGELFTAISAGVQPQNIYFHGNNKTDSEIEDAIESKIGYFIADSTEEISTINEIAKEKGRVQDILLRITPGIDPHTYAAVATGKVDSKFGFAIQTGAAKEAVLHSIKLDNINLVGFHCHIGSQVFDSDVYFKTADVMLRFIADIKAECSYQAEILNLGGGYGVRYVESDPKIDIFANIAQVADRVKGKCEEYGISVPSIRMEPGRSIVADAGLTLYTVGSVKNIPTYKSYVSVDGGMTDNPRYALYGSAYTVVAANKMTEDATFNCTLAGRCCESGDIIQENVNLPESVCRGDIVAVLTTGAYNYSMASNYNRVPRPPVVMLNKKEDYVAVKRETYEDITLNDL